MFPNSVLQTYYFMNKNALHEGEPSMPTLEWIGKEKVINHHQDVPFRLLEKKYTYNAESSENMIIHGDNLLALKSLLPKYEGRVDCIYIDPPYNTGNEKWVYNDNVNDPRIKKWLGEVVGAEGEDFTRHDKWLCMMYPRLRLLHKLLSDHGAIFISIDDNEQANLKLLCDEIFGRSNFVATFQWRKRTAKSDVPHGISQDCEFIICYAKSELFQAGEKGKERKYYESADFPGKPWRFHDLTKQTTIEERPNSDFTIINPKTGEEYPVNPLRSWAITKVTFQRYNSENRIIFPGDYDFLNITKPVLRYWKEDDEKKAGDTFGLVASSTYLQTNVGMTQDGTKELISIFGNKQFSFPKPSTLIRHFINIATIRDKNAIILDSFAGSGTTAHAVLDLNKQDGGNRKFILVEMMDYAENITAERVRRVIDGYDEGNKVVDGLGGDFSYYELGEPLFDEEGKLNTKVPTEEIRKYIYYMETKLLPEVNAADNKYFLGKHMETAYYFYYEPDRITTLNRDFLATVTTKAEGYLIYADVCALSPILMEQYNITFKKIPRDIRKL